VEDKHCGSLLQCGRCKQRFQVAAIPAKTPPAARRPPSEEDVDLILDGPAAAMLTQPAPQRAAAPAPPKVAATPARVRLDIGSATSPGKVRTRNEDSFLVQQLCWANHNVRREIALVVVADGLGGHQGGDRASGMVIRQFSASLAPLWTGLVSGQPTELGVARMASTLENAIREANRVIYQTSQRDPTHRDMGATLAGLLLWEGQVQIGHVGDCRVYRFHKDQLTQVTRDQTLVERLVELGKLTPREALTHPSRNEVTQAVGSEKDIQPALYQLPFGVGDWLIVACDGLHAHVDNQMIVDTLRSLVPSAGYLAQHLVELANQKGGSDNCTVVAIRGY
jgi:protein phosphatase